MKDEFIGRYFKDKAGDVAKILGHDAWGTRYYVIRLYIAAGPDAGKLSWGHIDSHYLHDYITGKGSMEEISQLEGMLILGE
jgi:hypothetical protein